MIVTRRAFSNFTVSVFVLCAALPAMAQPAPPLAAKTSDGGGVRVAVKPKTIGPGGWEFEVTMDTHTTPLNDDLTKTAVLVDSSGSQYIATAWQGDPPGGHHRKGVLRFPAPTQPTKSFELQMQSVGGVKRVFQWFSQ